MYAIILLTITHFGDCRQLITPPGDVTSEASLTRGTAHEAYASRAVATVNEAESDADDYVDNTVSAGEYMKKGLREAKIRMDLAFKDKLSATEALEAGRIASKYWLDWARKYGAQEMEGKLGPLFKKFEDWKMGVLHNPTAESKKAAYKAAEPFEKAMMATEKRVKEYTQRAEYLSSTAAALRGAAVRTAAGGAAKQAAAEDLNAAQTDMMNAHQMIYQADDFETQALANQEKAKASEINIPLYKDAANNIRQATLHRYDPEHVPPPPPSPKAFIPPPPSTNILLQVDA